MESSSSAISIFCSIFHTSVLPEPSVFQLWGIGRYSPYLTEFNCIFDTPCFTLNPSWGCVKLSDFLKL